MPHSETVTTRRPALTRTARALALLFFVAAGCSLPAPGDNAQVQNRGEGKDEWWAVLPRAAWQKYRKVAQSQPWFEVYDLGHEVFAIYEPGQFEEVISYLIVGTEQALLFDSGLGIADMRRLIHELTDRPVIVLNSHSHYDHIGGNHLFETVYGRDTDYTRGRAQGLTHDEVSEFVGPGWIWKDTPEPFDPTTYSIRPFGIAQFVSDGMIIDLGARALQVIFTPGHAPDAICLLDRDNRILFTGDTFYLAPLYTHLPGSDFDTYRATARRLVELHTDVDVLMPGHNEPAVSARYLVQLREAFDAIADGTHAHRLTDGNREYAFDGFSVITSNVE